MLHHLELCAQIVIIDKMKVLIIFVLTAVVLVQADSPYKYLLREKRNVLQVCTPGETRKEDCNNCFCISDGSGWACTRMGCVHRPVNLPETAEVANAVETESEDRSKRNADESVPYRCIPNSTWMEDCNTCFCTADGSAAGCTLMMCYPHHFKDVQISPPKIETDPSPAHVAKRDIGRCVAGTRWKEDCNNCWCTSTGFPACTLMACMPKDWNLPSL